MASYRFELTENDLIWAFTMPGRPEIIQQLLTDPIAYIHAQPECGTVKFSLRKDDPLTLLFQYGQDGDEFLVHGVEFTNLISVRGPNLTRLAEINPIAREEYIKAVDPTIEVKRLEMPRVSYAHFDPAGAEGQVLANTARIIANPGLLPAWLNDQLADTTPLKVPATGSRTPIEDDKTTHFHAVSDRFRFVFQKFMPVLIQSQSDSQADFDAKSPVGSVEDEPTPAPPQCVKVSGEYVEDGDTVEVTVDEARQLRWVVEENPGGGLPPILIPG